LEKKGVKVIARVDHAKAAAGVGIEMPPLQLLIFGNPKLGSPLMTSNPTVGIDLPMKMIAWQDAAGQVHLAYNQPKWIAHRHGINDRAVAVAKLSGALAKISQAVVAK